jgi:hypothetical protein
VLAIGDAALVVRGGMYAAYLSGSRYATASARSDCDGAENGIVVS